MRLEHPPRRSIICHISSVSPWRLNRMSSCSQCRDVDLGRAYRLASGHGARYIGHVPHLCNHLCPLSAKFKLAAGLLSHYSTNSVRPIDNNRPMKLSLVTVLSAVNSYDGTCNTVVSYRVSSLQLGIDYALPSKIDYSREDKVIIGEDMNLDEVA